MDDQTLKTKRAKANSHTTISHPPNMVDESINTTSNLRRQLPNELIEVMMEHIKVDGNFKTLAAVARANQNMYNVVIPKLYESVTVTEKNERHVAYGHTPSPYDVDDIRPLDSQPNRKDIATTFTRKLVLNSVPSQILPEHYTAVTTVVVMAGSLFGSDCFGPYSLSVFLGAMAKGNVSSTPVHIIFDGRNYEISGSFLQMLKYHLETPNPSTQEFIDFVPLPIGILLDVAYRRQAVLHTPQGDEDLEDDFMMLCLRLFECLNQKKDHAEGRIYLCGVPDYVLSPAARLAAGDRVNTVAEAEVYRQMCMYAQVMQEPMVTWDVFNLHVQFVHAGFRPTLVRKTGEEVKQFQHHQRRADWLGSQVVDWLWFIMNRRLKDTNGGRSM